MLNVKASSFAWGKHTINATIYLPEHTTHDVLIMHGAGEADQTRMKALAKTLANRDCRVITFDFVGHGLSSGSVSDLTLNNRADQAQEVVKHFSLSKNLILIGFSMSGQTTIDLSVRLDKKVSTLVLFVPAMYDQSARDTQFGPHFTNLIREHESWRRSDAWENLKKFQGNLISFESPLDTVIPKGVIDLIHESAVAVKNLIRVQVLESPHSMALWISQEPSRADWFADTILRIAHGQTELDEKLAATAGVRFKII